MSAATFAMLKPQAGVDLKDESPLLLIRLERLAEQLGKPLTITSAYRSAAAQQKLWDGAPANGLVRGKTVAAPGSSLHQAGAAADVLVDGQPIQNVVSARDLQAAGLYPVTGDAVHVQLFPMGTTAAAASASLKAHPLSQSEQFAIANNTSLPDDPTSVKKGLQAVPQSAADLAKSAVQSVLGDLWNSVKGDALRALLYGVLVSGGVGMAVYGLSKMLAADDLVRAAAKKATEGAAVAAVMPK